ncbi:MAG: hybrid sensor histidine kinase/response regulator [Bacteroidales bacterium]|jgi:signal transduction histidine kinase|nr:hybrid sensor histidine kinase/response regulator [Bacteroidales bacterium]
MELTVAAKILIVDDNERNLQILEAMLRRIQAKVYPAMTGNDAIKIAQSIKPDLILLDIMMPEMDGFEVCKKIKKIKAIQDIPIIFISALDSYNNKINGFQSGGIDYITKPFNVEEVLARVKAHLLIRSQQQELEETNSRLREALGTKDRLFSIIAHDLQGPLSNLQNVLTLLTQMDLTEAQHNDFLNEALDTAGNTQTLLRNLLFWAKSQRDEIDFKPHNIFIAIIVDDNIKLLNSLAREKNISISSCIPPDLVCFADENMLSIIIRNIISNAIKFSNHKCKIRVDFTNTESELVIHIIDQGVGIPSNKVSELFNAATHFSTHGTSYEKGTGLGLLICREFIEKHRGRIWVESKDGEGSTFSFSIPHYITDFTH